MTTSKALKSLAAFLVLLILAYGLLQFANRPASAQYIQCYFTGACPVCSDTDQTYYCLNIFNDENPGNCSGGSGYCDSVSVCQVQYDCVLDRDIGECPYLDGCGQ